MEEKEDKDTEHISGAVLVVGGGAGGMRASLDLAESGFRVYLVESGPSIGGKSGELDCLTCKVCHRYFPGEGHYEKNPCGICEFPAVAREVMGHPNIEVLLNARVDVIEKKFENYLVGIDVASGETEDGAGAEDETAAGDQGEYSGGAGERSGGSRAGPELRHFLITAGAVILAPGFEEFDPVIRSEYGYGRYANVLTSFGFERMLSPIGPTGGRVLRPSDGEEPKRVAWLNCVGSRDRVNGGNYCSSVCCSFSLKEAAVARERLPELETTIFYMDMRTFSKGADSYREKAQGEHGVRLVRWRVSHLTEDPATGNLIIRYEDEEGVFRSEEYDMVVLSTGFRPGPSVKELARKMDVHLNEFGFCETPELSPVETTHPGIYVCGAFSGPKDIAETVAEASGAAARAGSMIAPQRNTRTTKWGPPDEKDVSKEEARAGVFVCTDGVKDSHDAISAQLVEYAVTLPNVVHAERDAYSSSGEALAGMTSVIAEKGLNRVIVASEAPDEHSALFAMAVREAGLNQALVEQVNLRGLLTYSPADDLKAVMSSARATLRMAAAKASLLEAPPANTYPVVQKGLVIGGGLAGMVAALNIAAQGYEVYIVERGEELGGNLINIHRTLKGQYLQDYLGAILRKVAEVPRIRVLTGSTVTKVEGNVGAFRTTVHDGTGEVVLEHGALIVATGAEGGTPSEYLFGEDDRVVTRIDFEERVAGGEDFAGRTIVMIQCVGSRDREHPYCSRVCCRGAVEHALLVREKNPDAQVYILYRDIMTYGMNETLYEEARAKGVIFTRYDPDEKPDVKMDGDALRVNVRDPVLDRTLSIAADLLVLSQGIVPPNGNRDLAEILNVPLNDDGFFLEAHSRLRPVDLNSKGMFLCGLAHSPRTVSESIVQARAAAGRAITILSKEELRPEGGLARVKTRNCAGCRMCIDTCPFGAISFDEDKLVAVVDEMVCEGCGACSAVCPAGIPSQDNFTARQMLSMIDAGLEGGG